MKSVFARHDIEGLLSIGTSFQAFRVLFETVRLGLFDALSEKPQSAKSLAGKLKLSADALGRLLRALHEMRLVEQQGNAYKNAALSQRYLCRQSENYIGDFFIHRETLQAPWAGLKFSLRHNKMVQPEGNRLADYPRQLNKFIRSMDALGRLKSERIREIINFNKFSSLLDLGGGIGTYAVSFARENRDLSATIVDLKDVIRTAGAYIKKAELTDRIHLLAGQCLADPLPKGPFDVVFISNLLHIYDSPGCKKIITKAVKVLSDKGKLVIHDYIFGSGDCVAVSLFDMTMLVGTPQGRCYEQKEIKKWMKEAGIGNIKSAGVLAGTSIMWGEKA